MLYTPHLVVYCVMDVFSEDDGVHRVKVLVKLCGCGWQVLDVERMFESYNVRG